MFVKKALSVFLVLAVLILSAPLVTAQNPGLSVLVQQVGDRIEVVVSILPVNGLEYCCISVDYNSDIMSIGSNSNGYSAPGWDYDGVYAGGVVNNGNTNTVKHAALFDYSVNTSAQQAFAKFVFTVKSDVFSEADFTVNLEDYEDSSVFINEGQGFEIYSGTTVIDTSLFLPLPEVIAQMDASIKMEDGKINITVSFPPVNGLDLYVVKVYFDKTVVSIENRDGYAAEGWEVSSMGGIMLDGNSVADAWISAIPINTSTRKAVSEFVFDIIDTEALTAAFTVCITGYNDSTVSLDTERTIKAFNLTLNCSHSNKHLINACAPTCLSEGYSGDLYCPDCLSVLSVGTALAKSDHNPGDWIVDKEPTSLEPGSKHKECTECGEIIETAEIPVDINNWEDFIFYEKNEAETGIIITGCNELISGALEIPAEIEGLPVVGIGGFTFEFCSSLTNVTIPDSVTSIEQWAFGNCSSLAGITIGNNVTYIGSDAFYNTAYYNDSVNWKDDLLYIGEYLIKSDEGISGNCTVKDGTLCIADDAFFYCSSLESITIPDSVTSIGTGAFSDCSSLAGITIGNGVTRIGMRAFNDTAYYNNISNWQNSVLYIGKYLITVKDNISGNYTVKSETLCIADWAFAGCDSLVSVTIPNSVISIGLYAFGYHELFTIYCYKDSEAESYAIINGINYKIIGEALLPDPDSNLEVNNELKALTGVSAGITTENLLSQFSGGNIGIYKDGEPLGENDLIGTGCVIQLTDGGDVLDSLTVVVKGDLDGDGKVGVPDARKALRAAVKLDTISDFQSLAADVDGSKKVEVPDARLILRVAVGLQGF